MLYTAFANGVTVYHLIILLSLHPITQNKHYVIKRLLTHLLQEPETSILKEKTIANMQEPLLR